MDQAEGAMLALDKRNTAERRHVHTHWEATPVRACSEGGRSKRDSTGVRSQQWWRTRSDRRHNWITACSTYGRVHASTGGRDGLNIIIVVITFKVLFVGFGGCIVGLFVVLFVPLFLSFLAMPGLCRFLLVTPANRPSNGLCPRTQVLYFLALVALVCLATHCMSMPRRAMHGHNHACHAVCAGLSVTTS